MESGAVLLAPLACQTLPIDWECARWHITLETKESHMRVSPYHSSNATDPDVHHVHDDCPSGQQIPAWNWRSGTNNYPLCKHCKEM